MQSRLAIISVLFVFAVSNALGHELGPKQSENEGFELPDGDVTLGNPKIEEQDIRLPTGGFDPQQYSPQEEELIDFVEDLEASGYSDEDIWAILEDLFEEANELDFEDSVDNFETQNAVKKSDEYEKKEDDEEDNDEGLQEDNDEEEDEEEEVLEFGRLLKFAELLAYDGYSNEEIANALSKIYNLEIDESYGNDDEEEAEEEDNEGLVKRGNDEVLEEEDDEEDNEDGAKDDEEQDDEEEEKVLEDEDNKDDESEEDFEGMGEENEEKPELVGAGYSDPMRVRAYPFRKRQMEEVNTKKADFDHGFQESSYLKGDGGYKRAEPEQLTDEQKEEKIKNYLAELQVRNL